LGTGVDAAPDGLPVERQGMIETISRTASCVGRAAGNRSASTRVLLSQVFRRGPVSGLPILPPCATESALRTLRCGALTALTVAVLAGCSISSGGSRPPPPGGAGVVVDPETGAVSVDPAKVPVLPACAPGQTVVRTAEGWACSREVRWSDIADPPAQYEPAAHTHAAADVNGLADAAVTAMGEKAPTNALNHDRYTDDEAVAAVAAGHIPWSSVDGKPTVFPPDAHAHTAAQVVDFDARAIQAMGEKAATNPLNHDRYTDTEAVAAITAADLPWSDVSGVTATTEWPGTAQWSRLANVPATFTPSAHNQDFSTITGITSTSEWAGTVPTARVTSSGGTAEARLAALESAVAALQTDNTQLKTDRDELKLDRDDAKKRLATLEAANCPSGWSLDGNETGITLCVKTLGPGQKDEMVKVGDFWIDRYEVSVCSGADGQQTGYGTTAVACSVRDVTPRGSLTWFQFAQACANAGKNLCTNAEWQMAVTGTPDPGSSGRPNGCNVDGDGTPARTRAHSDCASSFGAYDMIGNLWEWVADWQQAGKGWMANDGEATMGWPSGFPADNTWNIDGRAHNGSNWANGLPSAGLRGGYWNDGADAGAFAVNWTNAPSTWATLLGARCCARGGR